MEGVSASGKAQDRPSVGRGGARGTDEARAWAKARARGNELRSPPVAHQPPIDSEPRNTHPTDI